MSFGSPDLLATRRRTRPGGCINPVCRCRWTCATLFGLDATIRVRAGYCPDCGRDTTLYDVGPDGGRCKACLVALRTRRSPAQP